MTVLIVDDETPARDRLRRLIENNLDFNVIGEATNGVDALEKISTFSPDVVFLDIEMPELDGLEVAATLQNTKMTTPSLVFITAFDEFALKAFELSAIDYLVKPVSEERLKKTLGRLSQKNEYSQEKLTHLFKVINASKGPKRFAVRSGARFFVVDPNLVSAVIARNHYAAILCNGKEILADDPLDALLDRLDPVKFLRIHRSGIINLEYLKELEREGDRKFVAVLDDPHQTRVPVSRERLSDLMERLKIK